MQLCQSKQQDVIKEIKETGKRVHAELEILTEEVKAIKANKSLSTDQIKEAIAPYGDKKKALQEQIHVFSFDPDQPNREYDAKKVKLYYAWAIKGISNKKMSMASGWLQIAKSSFIHSKQIATAGLMTSSNDKQILYNVNFVLDEIGVEKDNLFTPEKINSYFHLDYGNISKYYKSVNPFVVERFSFLIAHELMHSILGHARSFYSTNMPNHKLANVAKDCYINNFLKNIGYDVSLTQGYLYSQNPVIQFCSPFVEPDTEYLTLAELAKKLKENWRNISILEIYDVMEEFLKSNPQFAKRLEEEDESTFLGSHGSGEGSPSSGNSTSDNAAKRRKEIEDNKELSREQKEKALADLKDQVEKELNGLGNVIRELSEISGGNGASKFGEMFEQELLTKPEKSDDMMRAIEASAKLKAMQPKFKKWAQDHAKTGIKYRSNRIDPKHLNRQLMFYIAQNYSPIEQDKNRQNALDYIKQKLPALDYNATEILILNLSNIAEEIKNEKGISDESGALLHNIEIYLGKLIYLIPPFVDKYVTETRNKCIVYLDVSGSLYHMARELYGMLNYASEIFDLEVKLFSTTLNPINLSDLRRGVVKSTGGTNFAIWAQDVIDNQYPIGLVITDGYDHLDDSYIQQFIKNGTKLNYLLVDGDKIPENMAKHADNIWDLKVPKRR